MLDFVVFAVALTAQINMLTRSLTWFTVRFFAFAVGLGIRLH